MTQGQKIAEMGNSDSKQVGLYFELRYDGQADRPGTRAAWTSVDGCPGASGRYRFLMCPAARSSAVVFGRRRQRQSCALHDANGRRGQLLPDLDFLERVPQQG